VKLKGVDTSHTGTGCSWPQEPSWEGLKGNVKPPHETPCHVGRLHHDTRRHNSKGKGEVALVLN
jgi:hypothetical protein